MSEDDAGLVRRALAGEGAAWSEMHARHAAGVRRVCRGFAGLTGADVEDIVQETFERAFRNLDRLRRPELLRPWILTIARSRALNRLSGRTAESRAVAAYLVDPAVGPLSPMWEAELAERERRVAVVRELLEGLPEGPEKETVRLFYLEGRSSAREIAETLGVGKSTVTMRLERFRSRVKRRLAALIARAEGEHPVPGTEEGEPA